MKTLPDNPDLDHLRRQAKDLLAGWWIALTHLLTGIAQCVTIIGIPFGIANFKLIPVALMPLGKQIVDIR